MPLLGPMELGKKSPNENKALKKWTSDTQWPLGSFSLWLLMILDVSLALPAIPCLASLYLQFQRPTMAHLSGLCLMRAGSETGHHRTWSGNQVVAVLFPCAPDSTDSSRNITPKYSLSPRNTVIKYWNTILYFPGFFFTQWISNQLLPQGINIQLKIYLMSTYHPIIKYMIKFQVYQFFKKVLNLIHGNGLFVLNQE